MDSQKQQVVERLKQANNILVTVRSNPSVDQLAACIGVTLALNKMGKHATAVFSGAIPSTIEFLQPEKTLEKNTDSLQDFIIALDKSKADKLRYKVEDTMVKIFITPYRTSINQNDLQFSQGDFNVDVVLALGVHAQSDLDQAITSHGRILHDATVMSINTTTGGELGSINWIDAGVSSLSELGVQMIDGLGQQLMDGQIATSFLTGIVAETERFSNEKTSPQTMSISAELMSAGANQQLVSAKLEEPAPAPAPIPEPVKPIAETQFGQPEKPEEPAVENKPSEPEEPVKPKTDDGTIEISHSDEKKPEEPFSPGPFPAQNGQPTGLSLPPVPPAPMPAVYEPPQMQPELQEEQAPQIHIDEHGMLRPVENQPLPGMISPAIPSGDFLPPEQPLPPIVREEGPRLMTERPTFETPPLTANAQPESDDMVADPLSLPSVGLLNREPLPSQQPISPSLSSFGSSNLGNSSMPTNMPSAPVPTPFAPQASAATWNPPADLNTPAGTKTLSEIEQEVHSPHTAQGSDSLLPPNPAQPAVISPSETPAPSNNSTNVTDARDAVAQAINADSGGPLPPITELNALPLGGELHNNAMPNQQQQVNVQAPSPTTFQPGMTGQSPPQTPPPIMPPNYSGQ